MAVPLLTPPPLRGVELESVVGAGLIRDGVGDSAGCVGGVERVRRRVRLLEGRGLRRRLQGAALRE